MLFRLKKKVGNHEDNNGKIYRSGEYIESASDLTKQFKGKFEKIQDPDTIARITKEANKKVHTSSKPDIKKPKAKNKKKSKPSVHPEYGTDVSKDFPISKELGLKIYEKNKWFNIIDPETEEVLNGKKLRAKKVKSFLEKYQEELEDEEDEEEVDEDEEEDEEVDDDDDEEDEDDDEDEDEE